MLSMQKLRCTSGTTFPSLAIWATRLWSCEGHPSLWHIQDISHAINVQTALTRLPSMLQVMNRKNLNKNKKSGSFHTEKIIKSVELSEDVWTGSKVITTAPRMEISCMPLTNAVPLLLLSRSCRPLDAVSTAMMVRISQHRRLRV